MVVPKTYGEGHSIVEVVDDGSVRVCYEGRLPGPPVGVKRGKGAEKDRKGL